MTKNLVPLFILIIASFVITSCNKLKDIVFFDTPLAIDSVQLVDYPNIKLKITQNAEGLLLQNNSILPHIDSTKNLKLKFYCKNLKLISSPEIILAPLTNLVDNGKNWQVDLPVNIHKIQFLADNGNTVGLTIKFTALNFDPPKFTSFVLNMNPNGLTPLAGLINYTSNQPASFKYTIKGQDGEDFSHKLDSLKTTGTDALFGLYANYKNQITVTLTNIEGSTFDTIINITSPKLPGNLPDISNIIVNKAPTANAKAGFL